MTWTQAGTPNYATVDRVTLPQRCWLDSAFYERICGIAQVVCMSRTAGGTADATLGVGRSARTIAYVGQIRAKASGCGDATSDYRWWKWGTSETPLVISPPTMFLTIVPVKQKVPWPAQTGIQQGFIKTSIEINNRYRTNAHLLLIAG
jgi:hypothetical protein